MAFDRHPNHEPRSLSFYAVLGTLVLALAFIVL